MKNLCITTLILLSAFTLFGQKRSYYLPKGVGRDQISKEYIIVKLKNDNVDSKSKLLGKTQQAELERAIPISKSQIGQHPLSNIYKIKVTPGTNIIDQINHLLEDENVIYAEPYFNYRPLYIPNDPEADPTTGGQTYLSIINAYDAWTIESGDSTIVIGILDSGVELDHPDLASQIAFNLDDPINGIDDDNDGLIDNYSGWDIADNDNTPLADTDPHGTEVSAMSSARVNNNEGMAGTGFRSKFLPIKIFTSDGNQFRYGYEAIAMAADLGCKIINLSWGSEGSYSQFGQEVIDYAVLEKDVLVIAAAGNTDGDLDFYPASFDNVLSIGATNMDDEKANFSTYSYKVDLMAPGKDIFTAINGGEYASGKSGTSFSAPLTAGAAALVRARYPDLSALQVAERIRATADDIYNIGLNSTYIGKLGKGRLNMLRALTDVTPSLRLDTMFYTNGAGALAFREDTLSISIRIKNYLDQFNSGTVTLSTESEHVTMLNNSYSIASLGTLKSSNNYTSPFKVILSDDLPSNESIAFRLDYNNGVYSDFEYFKITTSPAYYDVISGELGYTVSGDGDLGYDESNYNNGNGVMYNGNLIAENIGPILSFSKTAVIDNAPNELIIGLKDEDFETEMGLKSYHVNHAPIDIRSVLYNEDSIRIEQKSMANGTNNFIIQEYRLINLSSTDLTDFSLSLFADWNLGNKDFNEADWSGDDKLGYIHDDNTYVGIALLTNQDSAYSAINNKNFNGNTADIPNSITDSVKYAHSSGGILKTKAGEINGGNDVSHLLGAHIDNLSINNSVKVAFVIVAGSSLTELISLKKAAQSFYDEEQNNPLVVNITETCIGQSATINPNSGVQYNFYEDVELNNLLYSGEEFTTPPINSPTTYFVVNKDESYNSDIYRVIAKPKLVNADFSTSSNPLLLDETGNTSVQFTDVSIDGVEWNWDFDNGYTSIVQNPIMNFPETGTYAVQLEVTNDIGCKETINHDIIVANRSNLPDIPDQKVCKNEMLTLSATNATALEFYSDDDLNNLMHSGNELVISFDKDTTIYVISTDSVYQSNVKSISIDVDDVTASFTHHPDTLNFSSTTELILNSTSTSQVLDIWYINDQLASTNSSFSFDYNGLDYMDVKLKAESINSCTDSLVNRITFSQSAIPTQNDFEICEGVSITVNPEGEYLHFYSDASLNNLIAKGSMISLPNLKNDTSIFITNNSNYLESDPLEVFIDVKKLDVGFSANPPQLNLTETSSVQFTDSSNEAISWVWLSNSDTISFEQSPNIEFNEIGVYDIELIVTNELGCMDSILKSFEVVSITSIDDLIENNILIYPNPAEQFLFIKSKYVISATLNSTKGDQLIHDVGADIVMDVTQLKSGIYILALQTKKGVEYRKIVIQQ